jgi:hypothetical protein
MTVNNITGRTRVQVGDDVCTIAALAESIEYEVAEIVEALRTKGMFEFDAGSNGKPDPYIVTVWERGQMSPRRFGPEELCR